MAGGGHHHPVKIDPAIERWNYMRENVYQTFKLTPKASRQVFVWGLIFPAVVAGFAWNYDAKLDWAGKRRGESLLTNPPPAVAPAASDEE